VILFKVLEEEEYRFHGNSTVMPDQRRSGCARKFVAVLTNARVFKYLIYFYDFLYIFNVYISKLMHS